MKNRFFIFAGFLLVMVILLNIYLVAAEVISCNPTIKLVSQDPNPAVPNDYVKVIFEVTSVSNCDGFSVRLNPEYPFSLDSDISAIQTIETNPYAPGYRTVWMIPYNIRIDSAAFDGDYHLKLQYHEESDETFNSYIEKGFNITIEDSRTKFDAVIQESSGSDVSIAIANIGKYAANSVVIRIPEQESFSVSGTDGQMVGNLASGDYTLVSFAISSKSVKDGVNTPVNTQASLQQSKNLKFDISYTDNIGERRIVNMELPLRLGASVVTGGPGRTTTTTSTPFYFTKTFWIIIIILIILGYLYRKNPEKSKEVLHKLNFFSKSSKTTHSGKIPDWVKHAKEKEKK